MTVINTPLVVRAEVTADGLKHRRCHQVPLHGFTTGVPAEAWRTAVRMATQGLFAKALICDVCADPPAGEECRGLVAGSLLSTLIEESGGGGCAPVRLTVEEGQRVYPLTEDLLTVYGPGDQLRLIATTTARRPPYAALNVMAQQWTTTGLWWRHRLMEQVVEKLHIGKDRRAVRTFIWDGKREIPYRHNWTRPATRPGR
ncbi:hypothetical protein [Streptomyces sp. NPDC088707]|uniref:hypothetical protein n=1 Tax=Streptomyces sp. NPDC088707 TaxID=3365871 RepID=UPI00380DF5F9